MASSHRCSIDMNARRTMTCDPIFVARRREISKTCGRMTVRHDNEHETKKSLRMCGS
jgi:hypothetical protein